jgi:hypothetical protein
VPGLQPAHPDGNPAIESGANPQGQVSHEVAPVEDVWVPVGHNWHAPSSGEKVPGRQATQVEEGVTVVSASVPGPQVSHSQAPVELEIEFAGQVEQDDVPPVLYFPAGHAMHDTQPTS